LAGVASAETLPLALADALGLQLSGQSNPLSDVLNFLAGREMLLVLDNFEQLLDGVDILNKMLHHCPAIKILVTSREPLQIAAEWRLSLEGLTYPPEDESELDPETIESFEAIQLFVQAVRQVRPNFRLTPENVPLLQRLCCMVDGMPLALRLSATWMRAMSLANIISEVDKGLDILETSMRDIPERQQSMRVIFSQAWTLLNEKEKRVFPALSVFRGGFDGEAVAAAAAAKPWLLAGLVDRGLLQLSGKRGRYSLHELTRQYAAEKLKETGDETAVAQKHSQYYLGLIARYDPVVLGVLRQSAIAAIRPDIDKIRQAWRWALETEALDSLEESINGLAAYFEASGLFNDAIQHFGSAAERIVTSESAGPTSPARKKLICHLLVKEMEFLELRGSYDQARITGSRILNLAKGEDMTIFRADAYRVLGILSRWAGELNAPEKNLLTAAALYEELGAIRRLATTMDWLALSVSDYGQIDESLAILEKAAELHKQANNQRGLVFNKGQTAVVLGVNGRMQESLAYQLEVLEEYQAMGYPLYISRTANNIGLVNIDLGEYEDAVNYMEQGLQIQRQTGALFDTFNTLGNKGEAHLNLGEYREARHCFEEAQRYFKDVDAPILESENLWRLAAVHIRMGQFDHARTFLERCLELTPKERDAETFSFASSFLAQTYWRQGMHDKAAVYFEQAAVSYDEVRRRLGLAEFVNIPRALFALEQGNIDSAETIHQEMQPYLENAGRNPTIFLSKLLEGQIAAAKGNNDRAREIFESLLGTEIRPYQEAAVYYELWQLTAEDHYAREARTLYQHLAAHTPDTSYQTRLQTLQSHLSTPTQ
jgi:predicted ATPase